MDLSIIILAGWEDADTGSSVPPALNLVAGWHCLGFVVAAAQSLDPRRIVVVGGPQLQPVCEALGEGVRYVAATSVLGGVGAVRLARSAASGCAETVLVVSGDAPLVRSDTLRQILEHHKVSGATVTLASASPEADTAAEAKRQGKPGSIFCFQDAWLWSHLAEMQGAVDGVGLMELLGRAAELGHRIERVALTDALDLLRVGDRISLSLVHSEMRRRINQRWMLAGVTFVDPATAYVDAEVEIGRESVIWPNVILQGKTQIGRACVIGPGAVIRDSLVGERCRVELSVLEGAVMDEGSNIGPFSHLRKGAHLGANAHVGNYGELKNSFLGPGAKMGHFSYLGDATVGADANIGAGTVTCNFDGQRKHATVIGEKAFIGSDTMLVAPVTVGEGAKTGAGAVVTHDVLPGTVVVGVPARAMEPTVPDE